VGRYSRRLLLATKYREALFLTGMVHFATGPGAFTGALGLHKAYPFDRCFSRIHVRFRFLILYILLLLERTRGTEKFNVLRGICGLLCDPWVH